MGNYLREASSSAVALDALTTYYSKAEHSELSAAAAIFDRLNNPEVTFAGMGSSFYAPIAALAYLDGKGIRAQALTAYDAAAQLTRNKGRNFFAVSSKSGATKEVKELLATADRKTPIIAIVNQANSALAQSATVSLPMHAGEEKEIASKSYICNSALTGLLSLAVAGEETSDRLEELRELSRWIPTAFSRELSAALLRSCQNASSIDVLAIGGSVGTAWKSALVIREKMRVVASAIDCADYAHGWYKTATQQSVGIVLATSYSEGGAERRAIDLLRQSGSFAILITAEDVPPEERLVVLRYPALSAHSASLAQAVWCDAIVGHLSS